MNKTINIKPKSFVLFIPFFIYILIFFIGISLPLDATPHYGNYTSRIWNWVEIAIALVAAYYIIRSKTFNFKQLSIALILGAVCLVALFRDPRYVDIIITSICVAVIFYGACRIFDESDVKNESIGIGVKNSIKYFALGAAISIPLALLNVFYFSLQGAINFENFLYSALFALKPAISEEVIFRYFMLALAYRLLKGREIGRLSSLYIYILMIIPHQMLHYPDMIITSPINAIIMIALNGIIFGLPMAILMKRKNLQMAMGMHWFIDFARFATGF